MQVKNTHTFLIGLILLFIACKPSEIKDPKEFYTYLSDPDNGLLLEKNVAGINYKVKYLPTEYLVYNASKNKVCSKNEKDSLIKAYANSLTFLLNIGPSKGEDFDITRLGVSNYQQFAQRIEEMAFGAQEWMLLTSQDKEYKPTIVRMENINAQDNSRNFMVVFSAMSGSEDLRKKDLCFSYNDELFNTGTNKFIFRSDDINNLPVFKF